MSEAIALQLLQLLIVAFPPLASLLAKYLPDDGDHPLLPQVRAILPEQGESARARRLLEQQQDADEVESP